jgi:predicted lipid-binding transport protein (Tim44 family)
MAATETLSVRVSPETRRILAESAPTRDASGASALARDILEAWAAEAAAAQTRASIESVVSYLRAHPDGWDDDPEDFFPGVNAAK